MAHELGEPSRPPMEEPAAVRAQRARAELVELVPTAAAGLNGLLWTAFAAHYLWWASPILFLLLRVAVLSGVAGRIAAAAAVLAYVVHCARSTTSLRAAGGVWPALRNSAAWQSIAAYLGLRVRRVAPLAPGGKFVFALAPHGVMSLSRVVLSGPIWGKLFPGIEVRLLGASWAFWWPGAREASLWLGTVDARAEVAHRVLAEGMSVAVYPGGSKETFAPGAARGADGSTGTTTELRIAERRGFVKLAMQHGAALVPVVVFNERLAFKSAACGSGLRRWALRVLRLPLAFFHGRWGTLLPFVPASAQAGLGVVFGAPIPVPRVDEPSREAVAALHETFLQATRALWEAHKADFGYGAEEQLVIKA